MAIDGRGERDAQRDEAKLEEQIHDPVSDDKETYVPPTDPVLEPGALSQPKLVGGFGSTSMDDIAVAKPTTGGTGDEALADAIRRELREDAATTHLRVRVEVNEGVVTLRGTVDDLQDAESAVEVADRVPGIIEVVDELEVPR